MLPERGPVVISHRGSQKAQYVILIAMYTRQDPYTTIAPYYDAMHEALNADVGMVLALAARGAGPLLEMGCGTGRLLAPLARAGHRVIGLDRSAEMLAGAQQRLAQEPAAVRKRIELLQADMTRQNFADSRFELIIIPYNTFMHLTPQQAATTCRRIRRQLAPGGRLFIDLVNPLLVEQTTNDHGLTVERLLQDEAEDALVLVLAANELEPAQQTLKITWVFDKSPRQGGPVTRSVVNVSYHYYFPHEIELLLQEAGLALTALYGNYHEQPYSEEAERLLVMARRP